MANIDTGGGDKPKKGKQKKQSLRVDFTPMVDMNMLLITFFMFCTSLSKPQTMEINMPSKDKVDDDKKTEFVDSRAVTILLSGDDKIYYYLGMPNEERYNDPNFLVETDFTENGLRAMLLSRNAAVHRKITDLKIERMNEKISEEDYKKQTIEIKKDKSAPQVSIKATEKATYKNLIDALDEMQIASIGVYAIVDIADGDLFLLHQKTGDPDYAVAETQEVAQ